MKNEKTQKKGIILMILSSFLACFGQLFWKLFSLQGENDASLLYLVLGTVLYGIGAMIMILAYRYGKLSVLQPVLSLNYVITLFLAAIVLEEAITANKILGVVCIVIGVLLISKGGDT